MGFPSRVVLHTPTEIPAREEVESPEPSPWGLENPWLRWMSQALCGQPIDVVQFVCPGCFRLDQGAIDLGDAPTPGKVRAGGSVVGAEEFVRFLTSLGAWSLILGTPAQDASLLGLRLLADNLSRLWPCPVLVHDLTRDVSASYPDRPTGLSQAMAFLLTGEAGAEGLRSEAVSLYCSARGMRPLGQQPNRVQYFLHEFTLARGRTLEFLEGGEGPPWVAPVQRYLEQRVAPLIDLDARSERQQQVRRGVEEALRRVVSNFLGEDTSEEFRS
jgi:hypothetical protein